MWDKMTVEEYKKYITYFENLKIFLNRQISCGTWSDKEILSNKKLIEDLEEIILDFNMKLKQEEAERDAILKSLSAFTGKSDELIHNGLITDNQSLFLKLIKYNLIEPEGRHSKITREGKRFLEVNRLNGT